jgi:hypothetical protein
MWNKIYMYSYQEDQGKMEAAVRAIRKMKATEQTAVGTEGDVLHDTLGSCQYCGCNCAKISHFTSINVT